MVDPTQAGEFLSSSTPTRNTIAGRGSASEPAEHVGESLGCTEGSRQEVRRLRRPGGRASNSDGKLGRPSRITVLRDNADSDEYWSCGHDYSQRPPRRTRSGGHCRRQASMDNFGCQPYGNSCCVRHGARTAKPTTAHSDMCRPSEWTAGADR